MTVLLTLIPLSLLLGLVGLAAFVWSVGDNQYEDPEGEAQRILDTRFDDAPKSRHGAEKRTPPG